jgi:hypothetical protein
VVEHRPEGHTLTGEMDLKLEALSKYIVTSPSWIKSLALILILSGCVEVMSILGTGNSSQSVSYRCLPHSSTRCPCTDTTTGPLVFRKIRLRLVRAHRGHRTYYLSFYFPLANFTRQIYVSGLLCNLACPCLHVPDAPSCSSR